MRDIVRLKEQVLANRHEYRPLKEYLESRYIDLLETIVQNNDKSKDDLLKGEARAYKNIIDLLAV